MKNMRSFVIGLALTSAACNPREFQEYIDTAPIRVNGAPENFSFPKYGLVATAIAGSIDGRPVSRIVASGGGGTPLVFTRAYEGGGVTEKNFMRCRNEVECAGGHDIGATMIPVPSWGSTSDTPRSMCVFAPANANQPAEGETIAGAVGYVACEVPSNRPQSFTLGRALMDARGEGASLRFSGFALPESHPVGTVIFGAHAVDNRTSAPRNGRVYALPDYTFNEMQQKFTVQHAQPLALIDPSTGESFDADPQAADFGAQVAGAYAGETLVFAVSQPSKQRVIVASYENGRPGEPLERFRVHACIEAPDASLRGFGERVLVGDLSGDGAPEIVIGTDPVSRAEPGEQALFVYEGGGLPGPVGGDACPGWNSEPRPVQCASQDGLDCEGSAFGSSLAIGDVDANGTNDLIVGAPMTSVGGTSEVGAVWILPGSAGLEFEEQTAMTVPTQRGARFGWSVAALHTKDRDEPVAGAPGVGEVYTIMCTPLESGFGGSDLCLD